MILNNVAIMNYKNIADARLCFSPGVNCLVGNNGMGKTNVLDAIYYMSFCKSFINQTDASVVRHGEEFMMLQGQYTRQGKEDNIAISVQRSKRKVVRRNGKEYKRLSQHIGLLPLVMVSPMDWDLIRGAGEERRRLMNQIISQNDAEYLAALIAYNRAVEQRNSMIRHNYRDRLLYETVETAMCSAAQLIHERRLQWIEKFTPVFMRYYEAIAGSGEQVKLGYTSHLNGKSLEQLLDENRERDLAIGYTTRGVHRDDIELLLDGHSMRKTGSQGQCKTYTIALRLAQFDFLKNNNPTTPILLLDDIFDKLDAQRVASIVNVVSQERFGQIFITDTNRAHIDEIITNLSGDYCMFAVTDGTCAPLDHSTV